MCAAHVRFLGQVAGERVTGCGWGGEWQITIYIGAKASLGIEQHYPHKRHNQYYKREEKKQGEWEASPKVIIASNGDT
ncbi:MAG: hypothetical protein ACJLS3_15310 [Erythrobacter sp.]